MNRINALWGDWCSHGILVNNIPISAFLLSQKINIYKEITIPFCRLYDNDFSVSLGTVPSAFLAKVDFRHWYFSDRDFQHYARLVSKLSIPSVMFCESPYGHEYPRQSDIISFEKKLYERTKIFVDIIKNINPNMKIVSPAIQTIGQYDDMFMEYLIRHRDLFDVYSFYCTNFSTEMESASLFARLNEVYRLLPKDVWVLRWAVPSNEEVPLYLISEDCSLLSPAVAAGKLKLVYDNVNLITKGNATWFYSGLFMDANPNVVDSPSLWKNYFPHLPSDNSVFQSSHFMGIASHTNIVKQEILDMIIKLKSHE